MKTHSLPYSLLVITTTSSSQCIMPIRLPGSIEVLEVTFEAMNTPEYMSHPADCSLKSNGQILLRNNRHNIGRG